MITVNLRRAALALAALAFAAAAPPPGPVRYAVGALEVTALADGTLQMPPALLHGSVPPANVDAIPTSVNAFLVKMPGHLVLIDAGLKGCRGEPLGHMLDNLKAAGYRPEEVDAVLLTHMHDDHVCGLSENGRRVFANATVYAAKAEAAFWLDAGAPADTAHRRIERVRRALAPYVAAGALHTFGPGEVLFVGVTALDSRGHMPGHTSYLFESGGRKLVFLGDVVHAEAVQFAHPDVWMQFDVDPKAAVAARTALFKQAAAERWLVAGAHLPFPGIGRVQQAGNAYAYVPLAPGQ